MRLFKNMIAIAMTSFVTMACQQNDYKIIGSVEGLADGDTLILAKQTIEEGETVLRKFTVNNGSFELKGDVDSASFCSIYAANRPDLNISFFLESGTITIKLSQDQTKNHLSGTISNNAWQEVNDIVAPYNERMQKMVSTLYEQNLSQDEQQTLLDKLQQMEGEMVKKIIEAAEKNIDNETGFFIVTTFADDRYFTPTLRQSLIDRMPAKFRSRKEILMIKEELELVKATEKGNKINDLALPTPEGDILSVMSIAKDNKLTIMDFWASWCGPCRQEMPNMVKLYEKYQSKGLAIVGISFDENHDSWTKAIKELGMKWPQISDLKGWKSVGATQFNITAIPHVIIIDQEGRIVEKNVRGNELERFIDERLQ